MKDTKLRETLLESGVLRTNYEGDLRPCRIMEYTSRVYDNSGKIDLILKHLKLKYTEEARLEDAPSN